MTTKEAERIAGIVSGADNSCIVEASARKTLRQALSEDVEQGEVCLHERKGGSLESRWGRCLDCGERVDLNPDAVCARNLARALRGAFPEHDWMGMVGRHFDYTAEEFDEE